MGAKKRAKLEAKAEKRQHREQELVAREEKKKKDALDEVERKKAEQAQEVNILKCFIVGGYYFLLLS